MYSKYVRRALGGQSYQKRSKFTIDTAVLVDEKKTSEEVMRDAEALKIKKERE